MMFNKLIIILICKALLLHSLSVAQPIVILEYSNNSEAKTENSNDENPWAVWQANQSAKQDLFICDSGIIHFLFFIILFFSQFGIT